MNESRWRELMSRLSLEANVSTHHELLACYNEKHRYYHNTSHINAVLEHLDETKHLAAKDDYTNNVNNYDAIEIALWFHDAKYNIFSSTNELDSANWASVFLEKNGSSKEFSNRVHSLIIATLHNALPSDNDEKLMIDIDLSVLGSEPKVYDIFESGIRKEYKLIPSLIYKKKRKEILSSFLERERIYSNPYFYEKLETRARFNISQTIKNL